MNSGISCRYRVHSMAIEWKAKKKTVTEISLWSLAHDIKIRHAGWRRWCCIVQHILIDLFFSTLISTFASAACISSAASMSDLFFFIKIIHFSCSVATWPAKSYWYSMYIDIFTSSAQYKLNFVFSTPTHTLHGANTHIHEKKAICFLFENCLIDRHWIGDGNDSRCTQKLIVAPIVNCNLFHFKFSEANVQATAAAAPACSWSSSINVNVLRGIAA